MKRIFAIVLALALMASLSITSFAADPEGNLSITRGDETYYYDYIAEAFDDAEDGDTIKVERDYEEEAGIIGNVVTDAHKSVTLDLNGKQIHFPAGGMCYQDHGLIDIYNIDITFVDTAGGGIIHAIVSPFANAVVKGGTYRGFWAYGNVTIEGGIFLGLPQDIVDSVWNEMDASLIGTKGLLLTTYDRVFLSEDAAREALDALLADGYVANKPYDITPYESGGEIRYSAGFAANTTIVKVESADTTVTYDVDPSYTVTIPTDVTIGGNSAAVSVEGVVVNKGQYVSVSLAADNDFTVKTAEGAELEYTVTANGENVAAGGEILAVNPSNATDGSAEIAFAIDEDTIQYAGDYTGTATFTIAVKDVLTINFTLDTSSIEEWIPGLTQNLQAEAGMTWGEWVESAYNVDGYSVYPLHWIDIDFVGPNETWAISRDRQTYDYVSLTDEIIAGYDYCFAITGG